jgi:hypothetical protein
MKQYHGSYSATEPPTNNNYKTRQIGLNEIIWKQYHASYSDTEPPTDTNLKPGLSYGKNVIATINNRWMHIQSKDFDGDTSIPTEKGLNKNWETIPWLLLSHRATYQHQLQNQAERPQ